MKNWSGANVAPISRQISAVPTWKYTPHCLRNQPSSLGPILSQKVH